MSARGSDSHHARVRRGSIALGSQLTYAARLEVLLNTLGRAREFRYFERPLSRFRSLHFIRWVPIAFDVGAGDASTPVAASAS